MIRVKNQLLIIDVILALFVNYCISVTHFVSAADFNDLSFLQEVTKNTNPANVAKTQENTLNNENKEQPDEKNFFRPNNTEKKQLFGFIFPISLKQTAYRIS